MLYDLQPVHNALKLCVQAVSSSVLVPRFTESSIKKKLFLVIRMISKKSKTNLLVKTVIPCEILKQKRFPRNSCSKGSARFRINASGGVPLQKSCKSQVIKTNI